jgi:hypothetical protein
VLALFGPAFWLMRGRLGGISFSAGDRLFSPARDTAIERKSARQS